MEALGWIVLVTAIAGIGGKGIGGIIGAVFKTNNKKIVSLLLSFAGGVMLSVVCFDLLIEAIKPNGTDVDPISLAVTIAVTLGGYGIVYLLNYIIDKRTSHATHEVEGEHPSTADDLDELIHSDHYAEHKKSNKGMFVAGLIMACAIALHNVPEGMVIGAAYVGEKEWLAASGLLMAITIGLHNIPEGMAVAVPLISGGMKPIYAVLITAASGLPTVIGAIIGFLIGSIGPMGLTVSLAFASGAMLYVVFGELLPESILMWRSKLPAFAVLVGILVGVLIVFI